MCGITGIFNLGSLKDQDDAITLMTSALEHRGPDGIGTWEQGPVALGHTRLAIIDLSKNGHQPMLSEDKRFVLVYNGEIYNYKDLRQTLKSKGYVFRSNTDTEVVLKAFACWGKAAVEKFNGMFAFAIWDNLERKLFLVRDRYGIKPLYFTVNDNCLLFASEVKAILSHPKKNVSLDQEALIEYFTFQNIFSEKTLFKDIHLLPAGTFMECSISQNYLKLEKKRYWDYQFQEPEIKKTKAQYLEELDHLFVQAVKRQLMADVEVGGYLSGGIDSGSITAVASREIKNMYSFTCGFDLSSASGLELNYDERSSAERMSYLFGTEHYEIVLKAGDMERAMLPLTRALEVPKVGQSYPNYYAAKLASKFTKVVLAGTGGDELFGGYPWRYYRAMINDNFEHYIEQYYNYWQRLLSPKDLQMLFSPIWGNVKHVDTRKIFSDVFINKPKVLQNPIDYLNHSLYFEAKTFLASLLIVEDKLSMAHSLETRVPFLDNDLVDFAMRLPAELKVQNLLEVSRLNENESGNKIAKYFQKTNDGKLLLREMMSRYLPQEVVNREKQGFSAPDASWFRGESINYVKALLLDNNAYIHQFLNKDFITKTVNEHIHGDVNRRLYIWSLLSLESWCQVYLKSSPSFLKKNANVTVALENETY